MELLWYQSRSKASFELPENKSKEEPNSFTNSSKLNPDYENIVDFPNKNKRCGNKDVPQYQLTMVVHWMSGIPASQPCISPYLSHLFPDTPALKETQSEYEYELLIKIWVWAENWSRFSSTASKYIYHGHFSNSKKSSQSYWGHPGMTTLLLEWSPELCLYPGLLQPLTTLD